MPTYQLRAVVYLDNKNECYKKNSYYKSKAAGTPSITGKFTTYSQTFPI